MREALERLASSGIFEGSGDLGAWRQALDAIRRADADAEKKVEARTWQAMGFGLVLLAGLTWAFRPAAPDDALAPGLAVAAAGAILAIWALVRRSAARRADYENRRYELAGELVELLSTDMDPEASISVRLDPRPHDASGKAPRRRDVNGWDEKHYVDPFLTLSGRFCDGTGFAIQICQHVRLRSRTRVNARGKVKTKSRNADWLVAALKLKLEPAAAQAALRAQGNSPKGVHLPSGVYFGGVKPSPKGLAAQAWSSERWAAPVAQTAGGLAARDMVASMLVSVFQLIGQGQPAARSA